MWCTRLGDDCVQFMVNGIAARLGEPAFVRELDFWYRTLGTQFLPFVCSGICKYLADPMVDRALRGWLARLADKFVLFLNRGVAVHIHDPAFGLLSSAGSRTLTSGSSRSCASVSPPS